MHVRIETRLEVLRTAEQLLRKSQLHTFRITAEFTALFNVMRTISVQAQQRKSPCRCKQASPRSLASRKGAPYTPKLPNKREAICDKENPTRDTPCHTFRLPSPLTRRSSKAVSEGSCSYDEPRNSFHVYEESEQPSDREPSHHMGSR